MVNVYIRDGAIYTSRNARNLPAKVYPPITHADPPLATGKMRGLDMRYPQLAYIPSEVRYEGPLAGRLAISGKDMPIEGMIGNYFLKHSVRDDWAALETTLLWLCRQFLRVHGSFPGYFGFYPTPESFGYKKSHSIREVACSAAKRSRDAFVPLMAMLSMAISMYSPDLSGYEPAWVSYIIQRGLSYQWLDKLRDSQIVDFKIPRVGTVIIAQSNPWIRWIERMEEAGVPVWFYWGHDNGYLNSHPDLTAWIPTEEEIHEHHIARRAIRYRLYSDAPAPPGAPTALTLTTPALTTHVPATPASPDPPLTQGIVEIPRSNPRSGQRDGETWAQFFERRAARNAETDLKSTPQERQRRQQMVKEQEKYSIPKKKGPRVFKWDEVNGFLLRTEVIRDHVEDIWEDYSHSQMRYDPFHNEWDLCTALDPKAKVTDPYEDWYDGDELGDCPIFQAPDPDRPGDAGVVDMDSLDISTYEPVTTDETLDRLLSNRFGFRWLDEFALSYPGPVSDADWSKIVKLLAVNDTAINEKKKAAVAAFVNTFQEPSATIPPLMWDLHADCPSRIDVKAPTVHIARIRWTNEDEDVYITGNGQSNSTTWQLGVSDALNVLECTRRALGPCPLSIARYMISKGMALNTWASLPTQVPPPRPRPPVHLGFRPSSFKPTLVDYVAYEERRNAFLSTPRARAALLMGGILWRLSKDTIQTDMALLGPSDDALSFGTYKCFDKSYPSHDPSVWYDDGLNEEELDLICGVYTVSKGAFNSCISADRCL
jgi:hypothetical protein